jgi:hypothetical protein
MEPVETLHYACSSPPPRSRWSAAPRTGELVAAALCGVIILCAHSAPWSDPLNHWFDAWFVVLFLLAFGAFAVLCSWWVIRGLVCLAAGNGAHARRWAAAGAIFAVVISSFLTQWPLHARFFLSRSSFDELLRSGRAARDEWIGWYHIVRVRYDAGGVVRVVLPSGLDRKEFLHEGQGGPPPRGTRLGGGWYLVMDS